MGNKELDGRRLTPQPAGAPSGLSPHAVSSEAAHQAQVFGIECEHHYGITTHALPTDGSIVAAVYQMVRHWHPTLTDEEHTWECVESEHWSRIVIRKTAKAPRFVIKPWWLEDGPGALWFSQKYRLATRESIQREVDGHMRRAAQWREDALRERPTKIGTKRAQKAWRYAEYAEREAAFVASRWPEFSGLPREGWQSRMHEHCQPRQALEARRGETGTGSIREADDIAVGEADAPDFLGRRP